jgi:erythromycin esterase-like protein
LMQRLEKRALLRAVAGAALPLQGLPADYDPLVESVGAARVVLCGEASHGTHEFYGERAEITKRLIVEKGFNAVAVEADWPDAYRVNRWVLGAPEDPDAEAALGGFRRFPTWMWRNRDVVDFVAWLRDHNDHLPPDSPKVGFYGLDLYSLHASMEAVISYLDRADPEAARRARARYACFDHFGEDTQTYGYLTTAGAAEPCEDEVVEQLLELQAARHSSMQLDGQMGDEEELFDAEQNARLVRAAEEYYRTMFWGGASSWNLRDRHMAETLEALLAHLERRGAEPRVVVWEHNSHVGDARATEMGEGGELNVGQLVRERHGSESYLVGFTTYDGNVVAASNWGAPGECMRVRPALPGSYEAIFHETDISRFLLTLPREAWRRTGWRSPGWRERSGSSTGPTPSGRATTSRSDSPSSLTRSSTWTGRALLNRSSR